MQPALEPGAHRGCLAEPAPGPERGEAGGQAPVPDLQQAAARAASRRTEESALTVRTRQRYEQVQALRAQGQGIKPIMRLTGLAKETIRRFHRAATVDELLANPALGHVRQGEGLIAGKISPEPALLHFDARISEEGGADVSATWASRR